MAETRPTDDFYAQEVTPLVDLISIESAHAKYVHQALRVSSSHTYRVLKDFFKECERNRLEDINNERNNIC